MIDEGASWRGNQADELAERQEATLDRLVAWLCSRGLQVPAVLFLEASKPLAPIGSEALLLLQPLIGFVEPMWGRLDDRVLADYAALFKDPTGIDRILARLEGSVRRRGAQGEGRGDRSRSTE